MDNKANKKQCVTCVFDGEHCSCPSLCIQGEQSEKGLHTMASMIQVIKQKCPSNIGLEDGCASSLGKCYECWHKALEKYNG